MTRRDGLIFALIIGFFGMGLGLAAQTAANETKSDVPELTSFHEIIYPIWHTAYPEKDAKALRSYVPRINELASKVYGAKLPGILRDKEAKWKEGVSELKKAVDGYGAAAAGKDDQALLKAAETLHARYEALVRTIRPVLKEVDDFHQALYVVYHRYLPANEYDNIRTASPGLVAKAEAVTKAALPQRLASKSDAFKKAGADLLEAAKALDTAATGHDHDGMTKGVERLHSRYRELEKIFD